MPDPETRPAFARAGDRRATAGPPKRLRREGGLRIVVADESGRRASAPGLAAWLRRVAPRRARGTVTIALVSDRRVRTLNRTYRRKDYATDVLSFPAFARQTPARASARRARGHAFGPSRHSTAGAKAEPPSAHLGDIVIARGVARRQAREAGHSERTELRVLALHGLLHLLGYDHERDGGRMRRVERRLRRQGGLREGLIERTR
jgi:probable rRNA maturation factor